jgi:hypothetical protein
METYSPNPKEITINLHSITSLPILYPHALKKKSRGEICQYFTVFPKMLIM